jgi:hypothetical protein
MYSSQEGLLQRSLNAVNIEPEYGMASNMRPLAPWWCFVPVVGWHWGIAGGHRQSIQSEAG